jgi:putative phosphoribosyl transferase
MGREKGIRLEVDGTLLDGDLAVPPEAGGLVIFAHGSGSSRRSSRNRYVAAELQEGGLATLLFDLLSREEEEVDNRTAHLRFDIGMLARRLAAVSNAMTERGETTGLPIGLFGASTGGGAALVAAAESPSLIRAVVSRGGRPDLAGDALPHVVAPTLLIVGSLDTPVIAMNRSAYAQMRCEREITIVEGASHLFEEEGTLEEVARLARDWLRRYLVGDEPAR